MKTKHRKLQIGFYKSVRYKSNRFKTNSFIQRLMKYTNFLSGRGKITRICK